MGLLLLVVDILRHVNSQLLIDTDNNLGGEPVLVISVFVRILYSELE